MAQRVAVAMSGGIDSAVAAALLAERCEVCGIYMRLCGDGRLADAERVCRHLGIRLHVAHFEAQFGQHVIDYFCDQYRRGRTPNPCVVCNRRIKFGLLLEQALSLEADCLATGHYARIERDGRRYRLLRGIDRGKAQSYFLSGLGQDELSRVMFPLGERRKAEVRRLAAERRLPVSQDGESQEVCFIPNGDYRRFIEQRAGEIIDRDGNVVGRHEGIARYTVGQRQGLGSTGQRRYVLRLDGESNSVVVGPQEALLGQRLLAADVRFVGGEAPQGESEVTARIRYRSTDAAAVLSPGSGDMWQVRFHRPQRAIAPGQAVVFYRGEEVLGGGTIESAG